MNNQMTANVIMQTLSHAKQWANKTVLIKLGGSVLDDAVQLNNLCADICFLSAVGIAVIIVHGGGKLISKTLAENQIATEFVDGLRVTPPAAMKIIEAVLGEQVNQAIVAGINKCGGHALGLSGRTDELLQCVPYRKTHGFVGKITGVNTKKIKSYINAQLHGDGAIPVIAPLGMNSKGQAYNINADCAASTIASALQVNKLIFVTDQDGIYDHNGKVISQLDSQRLSALCKNKAVKNGMLIKVENIIQALESGLDNIHIINGTRPHALLIEHFTSAGSGTLAQQARQHDQVIKLEEENYV